MRDGEAELFGEPPRLDLRLAAKRHEEMREALLVQVVERVGLIFLRVDAFLEEIAARFVLLDARIVARRDVLRADFERALEEPAEFHIAVAGDAGVRRAAMRVLGEEVVDDFFAEEVFEIHDVVRDAEDVADAPRIVDGGKRAAAAVIFGEVAALVREPHRDADDVIALLQKERGREGTVHAAAHADDDGLFLCQIGFLLLGSYVSIVAHGGRIFKGREKKLNDEVIQTSASL